MLNRLTLILTLVACLFSPSLAQEAELLDVAKVWSEAPHNAFTDLIRFKDAWYLSFREAETHAVPAAGKPTGKARIIRSVDGKKWESVALLDYGPDQDVRDPKLSVMPDGRLMVITAVAPQGKPSTRQGIAWYSKDGVNYGQPQKVGELDWWLWRVTWSPDKICYGIGYGPISTKPRTTRLYRSTDGVNFTVIVPQLTPEPGTGESTLLFRKDGSVVAICRRDRGADGNATVDRVGTASSGDLTKWTFRDASHYLGGPNLLELPDGRIIASGRYHADKTRTALCWLDPETGKLTQFLLLPSGGDNSYPGLAYHDGLLHVSYYSTHEGKTCIYFARVRIPTAQGKP